MSAVLRYESPLGTIAVCADDEGVTALGFAGPDISAPSESRQPALSAARRWLDLYFAGRRPDFMPPLRLAGTPFCMEVWRLLLDVPYGGTTTYGALAQEIARRHGVARMAAQAVGSAVGRNPVAIIVPCHRVVGADGRLVGYAGGLDRKARLLALEGAQVDRRARGIYNEV